MTWQNAHQEFLHGTDSGTVPVTDRVMVPWRDGAMTTAQKHRPTKQSGAGASDVVQLGLFGSEHSNPAAFVHPRHRRFAALLLRAAGDEAAALEILGLLEPELEILARRLERLGIEPDVARAEALSVAWEVVAGHRLGPLLPTRACLVTSIWTELRRELGIRRARVVVLVPLSEEIDVAAPESDSEEEPWPGLLDAAVAGGVLSAQQASVVAQTRIEDRRLEEVAAHLGRPYAAVRKERQRAERALASFASSYDAGGSR